jgi:hypothetical protein
MDDLDGLLRKYGPAGPPADLRERTLEAVAAARPRSRQRALREWLPPLAAAAVAALFYGLASDARRDLSAYLADPDRDRRIDAVAEALGGTDLARMEAERIITRSERAATDQPFVDPMLEAERR